MRNKKLPGYYGRNIGLYIMDKILDHLVDNWENADENGLIVEHSILDWLEICELSLEDFPSFIKEITKSASEGIFRVEFCGEKKERLRISCPIFDEMVKVRFLYWKRIKELSGKIRSYLDEIEGQERLVKSRSGMYKLCDLVPCLPSSLLLAWKKLSSDKQKCLFLLALMVHFIDTEDETFETKM